MYMEFYALRRFWDYRPIPLGHKLETYVISLILVINNLELGLDTKVEGTRNTLDCDQSKNSNYSSRIFLLHAYWIWSNWK